MPPRSLTRRILELQRVFAVFFRSLLGIRYGRPHEGKASLLVGNLLLTHPLPRLLQPRAEFPTGAARVLFYRRGCKVALSVWSQLYCDGWV